MAGVVWALPALVDLDDIAEWIALDKPEAARKLVQKVFHVVERLERFPESGRIPPELAETIYREVIVGPCRVFYRVDKEEVFIVHIMRGERQLRKFILDGRLGDSQKQTEE